MQADLPAQLGVDLVHCERQAEKVVQGSNGKTKIIQSEIMTEAYFDGVAAEVSDLLQVGAMCKLKKIPKHSMAACLPK